MGSYISMKKKEENMKKNDKIVSIFSYIALVLVLICLICGGCSERYLFLKYKAQPVAYVDLLPIEQKIYHIIFICITISAVLLLPVLIILSKAENPPLDYTIVDKNEYKDMQKRMVDQEYENMKQDAEINIMKVKFSSLKLKFQIFKKIFKHRKK